MPIAQGDAAPAMEAFRHAQLAADNSANPASSVAFSEDVFLKSSHTRASTHVAFTKKSKTYKNPRP